MTKSAARQRVMDEGGLDGLHFLETYQLMAYLGISSGKVKMLMEDGLPHGKGFGEYAHGETHCGNFENGRLVKG